MSLTEAKCPHDPALIQRLCHRKLGIGADGFIFLESKPLYDFEVVYYNNDASKSFCGNGSRCAVHLSKYLGIIDHTARFLAIDGPHQGHIEGGTVSISLFDVDGIQKIGTDYFVHTGSPHYVRLVNNLPELDVVNLGKAINQRQEFQNKGTNVNFVHLEAPNEISIRTYERGVYEETLSCGSGAVAAAIVACMQGGYHGPLTVITRGGKLQVHFSNQAGYSFSNICLVGPAMQVFQGSIAI
eukprot:gene52-75_t